MNCNSIEEIVSFLEKRKGFASLIERYRKDTQDRSFWFELVFACWLESAGYRVQYEVKANPENDSSVDFAIDCNGNNCLFELLRIENSDEVNEHINKQKEEDPLFESYQLVLNSDHKNPYFTTAAQTIRLQEKLLEKVRKFPVPEETKISIIVCDCSNIHQGMLDEEDVRIALFGKSKQAAWQEYWDGNRLTGMYEDNYKYRNSEEFRERVAAVIFLP